MTHKKKTPNLPKKKISHSTLIHKIAFDLFPLIKIGIPFPNKNQYMYRCIIHTTTRPKWCRPFSSLANYFLFFYRDSAVVFSFPKILGYFKDQIPKVYRLTYSSCPFDHFTLMFKTSFQFSKL